MRTKTWHRWLPSSKMTGVLLAGLSWVFAVWALDFYYEVHLESWVVAADGLLYMFSVGYAITEHRVPFNHGTDRW